MRTDDFDYDLPKELIAQHPAEKRDMSRLLVLDKETGEITHRHFYDIKEYLVAGDVLVVNNTKVIPARLLGQKRGGSAQIEVLLLKQTHIADEWEVLVRPGKRAKIGTNIDFGDGRLSCEVVGETDIGRIVRFSYEGIFNEILDQLGNMPLPPYITEYSGEKERYQTVYAKFAGSAAAPTAGLHFTEELLAELKAKGVEVVEILLHVGLGTFRPVQVEDVTKHKMHTEYYSVSQEAADSINRAKAQGRRIIAVGTTSTRTLESAFENGSLQAKSGETDIFIYPGYEFKVVDALITNFHLPKSTLVMLVSALADKESILHAYEVAVSEQYRFFSFGDAMFIK